MSDTTDPLVLITAVVVTLAVAVFAAVAFVVDRVVSLVVKP